MFNSQTVKECVRVISQVSLTSPTTRERVPKFALQNKTITIGHKKGRKYKLAQTINCLAFFLSFIHCKDTNSVQNDSHTLYIVDLPKSSSEMRMDWKMNTAEYEKKQENYMQRVNFV